MRNVKGMLAAAALAVGCCFAYGGDFSGTWTDHESGLTWSYKYVENWSDGLILTKFTGQCPENLTMPSCIPINQTIGNEVVTNDYVVEALSGTCCAELDGLKSVVIPPTISYISGDAFAGCGALEDVRFLGNVPAYGPNFEFTFETTFEGTPFLAGLKAANDNDYLYTPDGAGEYADTAREISGASGTVRDNNQLATPNEPDVDEEDAVVDPVQTFDPLRGYAGWLVGPKW